MLSLAERAAPTERALNRSVQKRPFSSPDLSVKLEDEQSDEGLRRHLVIREANHPKKIRFNVGGLGRQGIQDPGSQIVSWLNNPEDGLRPKR